MKLFSEDSALTCLSACCSRPLDVDLQKEILKCKARQPQTKPSQKTFYKKMSFFPKLNMQMTISIAYIAGNVSGLIVTTTVIRSNESKPENYLAMRFTWNLRQNATIYFAE